MVLLRRVCKYARSFGTVADFSVGRVQSASSQLQLRGGLTLNTKLSGQYAVNRRPQTTLLLFLIISSHSLKSTILTTKILSPKYALPNSLSIVS